MTNQQLQYICSVADEGSFSRAAERCFVTQPTLSQQVAKLEDELGIQIFERRKDGVLPTALGAALVAEARLSLSSARRIQNLAREAQGYRGGQWRLGVLPTLSPYLVPRIIQHLGTDWPELSLEIHEGLTDALVDDLDQDRLDGIVIASEVHREGLDQEALGADPFWVYVPPGHRFLDLEEVPHGSLGPEAILLLQEGHCFRDQALRVCGIKGGVTGPVCRGLGSIRTGSFETLRSMVDSCLGITLIPQLSLAGLSSEQRSRARPLAHPAPSRQVRLLWHRRQPRRAIRAAVAEAVRPLLV